MKKRNRECVCYDRNKLMNCFRLIFFSHRKQEEEEDHQGEIHRRWGIEQDQTNLDT